jgi:hypothetical protein
VRAPIAKQPSYEQLAYGPRTFIDSHGPYGGSALAA